MSWKHICKETFCSSSWDYTAIARFRQCLFQDSFPGLQTFLLPLLIEAWYLMLRFLKSGRDNDDGDSENDDDDDDDDSDDEEDGGERSACVEVLSLWRG